jgi:methanogenic corrinoid protein MtbC1
MEKTEWLQKAAQSILDLDEEAAKDLAQKSIEAGIDPLEMITRALPKAFARWEIFLSVKKFSCRDC